MKRAKNQLRQFKAGLRKLGVIPQHVLDDAELPLYDIYEDTFEVVRADTQELKEAAYRLRYQVYCVEQAFEDPANNIGGLEMDEYDEHSVHTLLIHRKSGMLVGNVRLVLPNPEKLLHTFPIQEMASIDRLREQGHVQRSCEISRFCISKNFRKREEDGLYTGVFLGHRVSPLSLFTKKHRQRIIPFTPLGLVRGIIDMALDHGITWGYALLEPQLIRLLKKMGIVSDVLGPAVSYHGNRYPVRLDPLRISQSAKSKNHEIWKVLTNNGELINKMESLVGKYRATHSSRR